MINETTFTRQFMQNWQRQRPDLLYYHKIADPTFGGDVTGARAVDVVACFCGVFVGMEWKLKRDNRAFPLKRVRIGQIKTLCDIEVALGFGYLMVAVYNGPRDKYVYAIPIKRWNEEVERLKKGSKSIRIEEVFDDCRIEMYRAGSYLIWDTAQIEKELDRARCC